GPVFRHEALYQRQAQAHRVDVPCCEPEDHADNVPEKRDSASNPARRGRANKKKRPTPAMVGR
ncbi:MAG: hypothetical protein ACLFU3_03625, partial [Dichotomicrobium sp.]